MILPDSDMVDIVWPDSEVEARWVAELERACRHLRGFRRTSVRAIIVSEPRQDGEAELEAVSALAEQLAEEYGLAVSVAGHSDHITVRLSRRGKTAGD